MDKFYSMLGLGKKAGYIITGETGCISAITKGKCKLLILASDASENTKKKILNISYKNNTNHLIYGEKEKLGAAVGKLYVASIAVTNDDFSKVILNSIK